ncbi:hypothetical protein KY363_00135 [Candidatus Woesearchaeota archaeon]|nr:hypothetical protein [Candidatus Woesearchaeota archaeon]
MGTYRPDITLQVREMWEHAYYRYLAEQRDVHEAAYMDWANYHARRFRDAYESHRSEIEEACRARCPDGCRGPEKCETILSREDLHSLLHD